MKGRPMGSFLDTTYHVSDPGELVKEGIIEQSGASSNVGFFAPGSRISDPTATYKILKKDRVSLEKLITHLSEIDRAGIQGEVDLMK
jgi:hypothetical protein